MQEEYYSMRNMRKVGVLVITALVVGLMPIFASTVHAAGSPFEPVITSAGCTITIEFDDVGQPGVAAPPAAGDEYRVVIWDDGNIVYDQTQIASFDGQTLIFNAVLFTVGQLAPGVGIQILWEGQETFYIDNYDFVPSCTTVGAPCGVEEGAYQQRTLTAAKLYWAADETKAVTPETFIPADKTVSVISNPSPGWLKISWACGTYYIRSETTGPNPDKITKPFLSNK
jgi:hypothetical protein